MVSLDILYSGPSQRNYIKRECLRSKILESYFSSWWSVTKKLENLKVENCVSKSPPISCLLSTCYFLLFYSILLTKSLLATRHEHLTNIFVKTFLNLPFSAWNFTKQKTPSQIFLGILCEILGHLFGILFPLKKTYLVIP